MALCKNIYLRGELAARARSRGYEDIEQGIYEIAKEEFIAQSKPYVNMKMQLTSLTPKVMVFTQDGYQLLNDYPPEIKGVLYLCDQAIANIHQRIFAALNTSRY